MSTERWRGRIEDILDAIREIQDFITGMTPEQFAADSRTVGAVSYGFLIIGEATRHVPDDVRTRYAAVPWAKMQAMHNVVAHDYRRVSSLILWETAVDDLPSLVPLLREIVERET